MRLVFSTRGWSDYAGWTGERKTQQRLNRLIDESLRNPASGIGRLERLSGDLAGCWSRRIDQEHRLVYAVDGDDLVVLQARRHY